MKKEAKEMERDSKREHGKESRWKYGKKKHVSKEK